MTEPRATLTVHLNVPRYVWVALTVALLAVSGGVILLVDAVTARAAGSSSAHQSPTPEP